VLENRAQKKSAQLTSGIELRLACGSFDGMPVEDHDFPFRFAREFFEAQAQVQFLGGIKFVAEATNLPECRRLDKNKRTGHEPREPARIIPQVRNESGDEQFFIEPYGDAASQDFVGGNFFRDVGKKFFARIRIGIHKHQPITGGNGGAGITGAGDLIDRLKNYFRPGGAGDVGGAIGGIIIADEQFELPAA